MPNTPGTFVVLPEGRGFARRPDGPFAQFGPDGRCPVCCGGGGGGGGPCACSVESGAGPYGVAGLEEPAPWGVVLATASITTTRRLRALWEGLTLADAEVVNRYTFGVEEPNACLLTLRTNQEAARGPVFATPDPIVPGRTITASLGDDFQSGGGRAQVGALVVRDGEGPVRSAAEEIRASQFGAVPTAFPGRGGLLGLDFAVDWPSVVFAGVNVEYLPITGFRAQLQANLVGVLRGDGVGPAALMRVNGSAAAASGSPFRPWRSVVVQSSGEASFVASPGRVVAGFAFEVRCLAEWRGPYSSGGVPNTFGSYDAAVRVEVAVDMTLRRCAGARGGPQGLRGGADDPRVVAAHDAVLSRSAGCCG